MNETILDIREATNLVTAALSTVMTFVFVQYIWYQVRPLNYKHKNLDLGTKGAIGFTFITLGELLRSSTIWIILHSSRPGSYLTYAPILIIALILITIGSLCCIRVFSPVAWGRWPCVGAFIVAVVLAVADLFF